MKGNADARRFRAVLVGLGSLAGATMATGSRAEDGINRFLDFEPRLSVGETYSDGGRAFGTKAGGWTTSVSPGMKVFREGGRVKTDVDYSLNNLYYHKDSETDLRHQLNGSVLAELLQNELFVDSHFRKRDQIISPLGPSNLDSSLQRDNLTSSTSWSVGPRWEHRFGNTASSVLDYQIDRVSFSQDAADDSWGTNLRGTIDSGSSFRDWFWSADYSKNDVRYSGADSKSTFELYSATAGYNVTRKLNVYYELGNEKNHYRNSVGDTGGSYWNVGMGWTPSVRTAFDGSFGKRFFGDTYSFSFIHRARRWDINLSRQETITTTRQQQLGEIFLICPPEIPDCTPEEAIAFGFDIGVRNGTYVQKSLNGAATYTRAKSALTLSVFEQEREFRDGSGGNDKSSGMTLGWDWQLGPRTDFFASTGWTRYRFFSEENDEATRWFLRTGLQRDFASDLGGSLSYSYQKRNSDGARAGGGGGGNTVSARLTKRF